MLLYKYRTDNSFAESIIKTGKVWLPTASELNDPLECRTGRIPEAWKADKIRAMKELHLMSFLLAARRSLSGKHPFYGRLPQAETRKLLARFEGFTSLESAYSEFVSFHKKYSILQPSNPDNFFKTIDDQLSQVGIFSLSEEAANGPLWAHYAENHKGLALGFEKAAGNKLGMPRHTCAVTYDEVKPVLDENFQTQIHISLNAAGVGSSTHTLLFEDATFRAAISTKPKSWACEKEWRYVEETHGLFPWPGPLREVIFGMQMPADRRSHYRTLVAQSVSHPVAFFEIKVSDGNDALIKLPAIT
jgi:hypothetical protein